MGFRHLIVIPSEVRNRASLGEASEESGVSQHHASFLTSPAADKPHTLPSPSHFGLQSEYLCVSAPSADNRANTMPPDIFEISRASTTD
jgi:hypothetical protein